LTPSAYGGRAIVIRVEPVGDVEAALDRMWKAGLVARAKSSNAVRWTLDPSHVPDGS
jgi:hypothetical protein